MIGKAFVCAAAVAAATVLMTPAKPAVAQGSCVTALEEPEPALTPSGIILGEVTASIPGADGEVVGYVLKERGGLLGLGSSYAIPAEFAEFAAGRYIIKVRDEEAMRTMPKHSC
jgi:hypothetical protein